jgi:hypothetical protein
MRLPSTLLSVLLSALTVPAQDNPPQPTVNNESLTSEQIAVYRAVLQDYLGDSKAVLNLADKTDPVESPASAFNGSCQDDRTKQAIPSLIPIVHRFSKSTALGPKVIIVDPDQQREKIKTSDPQNLIKKAIDDHEAVPENQLDDNVKQAFANGLFSFSEIIFDKWHRRALVQYGFVCGMLCGHGNTLILKKVGKDWKVSKTCSSWVS